MKKLIFAKKNKIKMLNVKSVERNVIKNQDPYSMCYFELDGDILMHRTVRLTGYPDFDSAL